MLDASLLQNEFALLVLLVFFVGDLLQYCDRTVTKSQGKAQVRGTEDKDGR